MARQASAPQVEPLKLPKVHKCNGHIFVTHEVDYTEKTLMVNFNKSEYSYSSESYDLPKDVKYVDYKHCPYCGYKFEIEIQQVEQGV